MKKHLYKIILFAAALAMAVVLTACGPKAVTGGQPNAVVYGNGSLVVKQGEYIYFVNGMTTKDADNKAGEVVKGAVMRAKLDKDGKIAGNYETIIAQAYFTSYTGGGLYIFGEWIYYVTPNPSKDKTGTTLNTQTLVMRTKIDGTKTKKIATIKAEGVQYKVTKDRFIYLDGTELKAIDLNKNNFKTTVIASDVTSAKFPKAYAYNPNGGNPDIYNYVVYTKNTEDKVTGQTHNEVKAVNGAGNEKTLISQTAYFEGNDSLENRKNMMTYTLGGASYGGSDLAVYLTRTSFDVGGQKENGTFQYTFKENEDYAFKKENVRWLASAAKSAYQPVPADGGSGILVSENGGIFFYEGADEKDVRTAGATLDQMKETKAISKGVKVYGGAANILRAGPRGNGLYTLYFTPDTSNGALQSVTVSTAEGYAGTFENDYKDFKPYEGVRILVASDFVSNWLSPSFETYGDTLYCYFIYAKEYNYLYRINLSEALAKDDLNADNTGLIEIVGKFNGEDQKAYDEREKAKK
ncbi:MAG: DUF5050 domain-containing protein [Clostridiales bacterium]|jgi:hypothetical protein|nr:DUF5050 domain-containing protein [Clostridiales bacterium]